MKKVTAILLSLCMVFSLGTVSVFADTQPQAQDQQTKTYYAFVERILGDFNISEATKVLNKYVGDLEKALGDKEGILNQAKNLIRDYFDNQKLDDSNNVEFLNAAKSVITVIATDPVVNENATKLIAQTSELVDYLVANKDNLDKDTIGNMIAQIAGTINTAVDAVEPYMTKESMETYSGFQKKLDNVTTALKAGTTKEKVTAVVTLVKDKGFQKVATNTIKTVVNNVKKTIQNTVSKVLGNLFKKKK